MAFGNSSGGAITFSTALSGVIGIILVFVLSRVLTKSGQNLILAAKSILGRCGECIVTFIMLIYLLLSAVATLGELAQFGKLIAFPTAPLYFVILFIILASICGVWGGKNGLSRLHSIFVPLIMLVLLIMILSTFFQGDITRLFPIFGSHVQETLSRGISGLIVYSDIILIFLLPLDYSQTNVNKKTTIIGSISGILIIFLFELAFSLNIPSSIAQEGQFPAYLLMKEVYYGRFFQRIDALILLVSSFSGMLYTALNIYLFSKTATSTFKTLKSKAVIWGYIITVFVGAIGVQALSQGVFDKVIILWSLVTFLVVIATAFVSGGRKKV